MQYCSRVYDPSNPAEGLSDFLFSRAKKFELAEVARQRMAVQIATLVTPNASILKSCSTGHEIEVIDDELVTVMLPMSGTVQVAAGEDRYTAGSAGSLVFLPSARHTAVQAPPEGVFESLMLKMPAPGLLPNENILPDRFTQTSPGGPLVATRAAATYSLRGLLQYLMADLASPETIFNRQHAARSVEVLILEQFKALFPGIDDRPVPTVSVKKLRQAEEFMRENFSKPISVADIACACNVEVRNLQMTFRKVTGTTPFARLAEIRLDEAYLRLIAGGAYSVTEVALDCGIAHLGRFSRAYRNRFGETPSETKKRGLTGFPRRL